jgi:hypothetical protein
MLFWANLHPGVIMGQGLLIGAIGWEWLNRRVRVNRPLTLEACKRLTLIGGLGLAVTLLSPDPIERLIYPFRPEVSHPIMRIFAELQPLYTFLSRPPYGVLMTYLLAVAVGVSIVLRFRQYRFWEIALLAGLAVLANQWYRSLQDWVLVMLALGVPHLTALVQEVRKKDQATAAWAPARVLVQVDDSLQQALGSPRFRFQWVWPAAALVFLELLTLSPLSRRLPRPDMDEWPARAVTWIESQPIEGRFFAPPNYGAYLIWRLGDRAKSYVDTRGFFYPPELVEDSHYVPQLGPDWRERLDRILGYGTEYFLLETTGARGQFWQALKPTVGEPLYCDHQTVLLSAEQVRRGVARISSRELAFRDR